MNIIHECRVYRFRELVALNIPGCPTIYITPKMADEMAEQMSCCVNDIRNNTFQNSEFESNTIEFKE